MHLKHYLPLSGSFWLLIAVIFFKADFWFVTVFFFFDIFVFGIFSAIKMFKQLPKREAYKFKRIPISGRTDNYNFTMFQHKLSVAIFLIIMVVFYFWMNSAEKFIGVIPTLLQYWYLAVFMLGVEIVEIIVFFSKKIVKTKAPDFYRGTIGKLILVILLFIGFGMVLSNFKTSQSLIMTIVLVCFVLAKLIVEYFQVKKSIRDKS